MTLKQWSDVDHLAHPKLGMPSQAVKQDPEQPDPETVDALVDRAGSLPGGIALMLQEFKLSCAE